jgi:hypothetical protein
MRLSIVAYRRSWREHFRVTGLGFSQERKRSKKKEQFGRGGLWKLPQPWKSIKVALGNFFLMISTAA